MGVINPGGGGSGGSLFIGEPITGSTINAVLFVGSANDLQQDPTNFLYDPILQQFQIFSNSYLATHLPVNDANGLSAFPSYLSNGGDINVTVDNFVAGSGAFCKISSGGRASGTSDGSGTPGAAGNGGVVFLSCGGGSDVAFGCSTGAQGNGSTVFISSGGADVANSNFGTGGGIQLGGCVDSIGGAVGQITGVLNNYCSLSTFYGAVDFLSTVSISTLNVDTLNVDVALNLIDPVNPGNTPVPFVMARTAAVSGEYTAQISMGGVNTAVNTMNFGQIYGDYDTGYTYFSYPNQFGAVGGANNTALTIVPASTAAVPGHVVNHVGINCVPTDSDYVLQFGFNSYGIGGKRNSAGSGSVATPFRIQGNSVAAGQPNIGGGHLDLVPGIATGTASADVRIYIMPAGGAGIADGIESIAFDFQSTAVLIKDAYNIQLGTSTGSKFGTGITQRLSFWNATPIVQPANTVAIDTLLVNTGLRATGGNANFATTVKPPTGSTTVGPIQLTAGTNLTTAVSGTLEYDGSFHYLTNSVPLRGKTNVAYSQVDLTGQTAAIAATTILAAPASVGAMYRIDWVATITTAATTSSVLGGAAGFQIKYTDADDSVVKTSVANTTLTSAANTTATSVSGSLTIYARNGQNIQYLMGYTSVGVTPMAYNLHIAVNIV